MIDVDLLAKAIGGDGSVTAETCKEVVTVCVVDGRSAVFHTLKQPIPIADFLPAMLYNVKEASGE